jgi:hypothetical protein
MADEITLTSKLRFEKGGVEVFLEKVAASFTVAGTKYMKQTQEIGTVEEAIDLGDAGKGGYLMGINLDSSNFMEIHSGAGGTDLIRLEPGDVCLFRVTDDAVPFGIADTAAVEFEYLLIEA